MANLKFIPAASNKAERVSIELKDIPQEVRDEVEETYTLMKTHPGRMHAEFDSLAELNAYVAQVRAYCDQRPDGPIRFRKSPSRGLPPTQMDFRIMELQTEDEKTTEEIRDAVDAVKAAPKPAPAKAAAAKK